MKTLLQKLNWRLILIHFLAFVLFAIAFKELTYLHDYKYMQTVLDAMQNKKCCMSFDADRLAWYNTLPALLELGGLLIAFIASLGIDLYKKYPSLNSILSFFIAFFSLRYVNELPVSFYITYPFHFAPAMVAIFCAGCILLLLGIFLLFSDYVSRFIDDRKLRIS